jgi:hypothetical protein
VHARGNEMEQLKLEIESRSLFEQITNPEELTRAYKAVKANKGAPGVDGITVEAFGENLKRRDNPTERRSNYMDIPTTTGTPCNDTETWKH